MVDRQLRDRFAQLIRHLATRRITRAVFDDEAESVSENARKDEGLWAVGTGLPLADLWEIIGSRRLTGNARRRVAIAILNLYSDLEYEWPKTKGPNGACLDGLLLLSCVACCVAGFVSIGLATGISGWFAIAACAFFLLAIVVIGRSMALQAKYRNRWEQAQRQIGDYDVWPFFRQADLVEARQHARLLCRR